MNRKDTELMAGIAKVADCAYKTIPGFISADSGKVHVRDDLFLNMLVGLSRIDAEKVKEYGHYRISGRWNGTEFFALFSEAPSEIEEAMEDEE